MYKQGPMDTQLITYTKKDTHKKLFYFEKRKKLQKNIFCPNFFEKQTFFGIFGGKNIFLYLGLNLEQAKSLIKNRSRYVFQDTFKVFEKKNFFDFRQKMEAVRIFFLGGGGKQAFFPPPKIFESRFFSTKFKTISSTNQ